MGFKSDLCQISVEDLNTKKMLDLGRTYVGYIIMFILLYKPFHSLVHEQKLLLFILFVD